MPSIGSRYKILEMISPQLSVTSGTPQRLSAVDLWVKFCVVLAGRSNAGVVYIGPSSSLALNTNGTGIDLEAREEFTFDFDHNRGISHPTNLKELWFDGNTTGDKLTVLYVR